MLFSKAKKSSGEFRVEILSANIQNMIQIMFIFRYLNNQIKKFSGIAPMGYF